MSDHDLPPPPAAGRGRPVGSIELTEEIKNRIVTLIRGGVFPQVAARACGVPERTFYEWLQRARGEHPTRPLTSQLEAFADAVLTAAAEARAGAEIRIYRENPKWWLSHAARTKAGSEGWSEPPPNQEQNETAKKVEDLIKRLDAREDEAREALAECPPNCGCVYHMGGNDERAAIDRFLARNDTD